MDIKLMKNSEKGIFFPVNDRLLMQITDDNYQYQGLQGKKYFILNAATNEKAEVAAQIKKYNFCKIRYACREKNYIFSLQWNLLQKAGYLLLYTDLCLRVMRVKLFIPWR